MVEISRLYPGIPVPIETHNDVKPKIPSRHLSGIVVIEPKHKKTLDIFQI